MHYEAMAIYNVAVVVGSIRAGSLNRKIARAMCAATPDSLACRIVEIGDLPLYNPDLDENPPAPWTRFRDDIAASQGVLFVTPEYNRSIPGPLKNALMSARVRTGKASGRRSRRRSLPPRLAALAGSAPTTIYASARCSSTCR